MEIILFRIIVASLFLLGIVFITLISFIQKKEQLKSGKLKALPLADPKWSIIIGIIAFLVVAYLFFSPIIIDLTKK